MTVDEYARNFEDIWHIATVGRGGAVWMESVQVKLG